MITLEEIIITRGDIEKIYKSHISLTLWRAVKNSTKHSNPLYPDMQSREIKETGEIRNPDVSTYTDSKTGTLFVKS